jgi:hypothetical protein
MSQINVTPGGTDGGDRTAAAGINFMTVLIVLLVLLAAAWFLFAGPGRAIFGGGTYNVNVNTNPPANTGGGNSGGNTGGQNNSGGQNTSPFSLVLPSASYEWSV